MSRALPLLAFLLAACGAAVDAPPPADLGPPDAGIGVVPLPATLVAAPVRYDVGNLIAEIEAALPTTFGDIENRRDVPGKDRLDFAIELTRSAITYAFRGDTLDVGVVVGYRGRVWAKGLVATHSVSCGIDGPPPRLRVRVRTIYGVDSTWSIRTRSRVLGVERLTDTDRDRCEVSFASIDVSDEVAKLAAGLAEDALQKADRTVHQADLRQTVEGIWHDLQQPLRITDSILWLMIAPEAVSLGPISVRDSVAEVAVVLQARPRFVAGPRPTPDSVPLPMLGSAPGVTGPATVSVEGVLPWEAASEILTSELRGKRVTIGPRSAVLERVELASLRDGRVMLGVKLSGSARGMIYLVGRVAYDSVARAITIPDLDLDVRSRAVLLDRLAWLTEGAIVGEIKERARLPVDTLLGLARSAANKELTRELADGIELVGQLTSVEPVGVSTSAEGVVAQARGTADLRLEIRKKGLIPKVSFAF